MHRTNLWVAAASLLAITAAPAAAQGFDGVIQFVSYEGRSEHPDTMTQITKGSKIRFEGMGHGGGAMIIDGDRRIVLMTDRKQWMEMPMDFGNKDMAAEAAKHQGTAVPTGKTETIAGVPCADWHYKGTNDDGTTEEGDACVAKNSGMMINRLSGGMAGRYFTAGGPEFAKAMAGGAGVMKVTKNGKTVFEAVKVEKASVPDAMFAVPPDYTKLDMGHMGAPPHKP
jgi:hypothetical protein